MSEQIHPEDCVRVTTHGGLTPRELTGYDLAIIKELYRRKQFPMQLAFEGKTAEPHEFLPTHAYVTTTAPVTLHKWQGHEASPKFIDEIVPAGRTLKIVMISRFEDFGLTDDMKAENGYHVRLDFDSPLIKDLRWDP